MQITNRFFKNLMLYFFPFIALLLCLFSKETSDAARKALYLCLDVVIPSLFPFFVLSKLIVPYISGLSFPDFLKKPIEKLFNLPYYTIIIIILGFLSGYPNGAKMSRDMFDQGLLDDRQASRILSVANNCSPLFIVGTVGAGLLKSVRLGVFLLLMHWVSGIIAAFITGRTAYLFTGDNSSGQSRSSKKISVKLPEGKKYSRNSNPESKSMSFLLTQSIEEAAILCIKVSGYIVFFAVISELLDRLGIFSIIGSFVASLASLKEANPDLQEFISAFSRGILEITSGSQAVSRLKGTALNMQLAVISLFFGFAGFSVHTQIMGIMKGTGCKYRVLFFGKLMHGIIAGSMTYLALQVMPMSVSTSGTVVVANNGMLWTRLVIISVLILSLIIEPYRAAPLKKK